TTPPNPAELLLNDAFERTLMQLQEQYDHVIIDTAPLLPVADTLAVLKHTAAAFLVVRAEQSTLREVQDALARLRAAGVEQSVKGIIFNSVRRFSQGLGVYIMFYNTYT